MDAIQAISKHLTVFSCPPRTLMALLPVVYEILDPSRIPAEVACDSVAPPDFALIALEGLSLLGKTDVVSSKAGECAPDLWSRAWPWLRFFERWESLGWAVCARRLPRITMTVIHMLSAHGPTHDTIVSTRGALRIFGKSWHCVLEEPSNGLGASIRTVRFLHHPRLTPDCRRLEELVDGVGSSQDLATLILYHLRQSSRDDAPFTQDEMDNLADIISFVGQFDCSMCGYNSDAQILGIPESEPQVSRVGLILALAPSGFDSLTDLGTELVRGGIVGVLSTALRKFSVSFEPFTGLSYTILMKPGNTCGLTAALLYFIMVSNQGFAEVPRAIAGGLLSSLIVISTTLLQFHTLGTIRLYFQIYLPSLLLWHSVLIAIDRVWPEVQIRASSEVFRNGTVFPQWQPLEALITHRLAAFHRYNSSVHRPLKMCGNVQVRASPKHVSRLNLHSVA